MSAARPILDPDAADYPARCAIAALEAIRPPPAKGETGPEPEPARRVFRCVRCVETEVQRSGDVCAPCMPAYRRARRAEQLADAFEGMPTNFRGLRLGSPELAARVKSAFGPDDYEGIAAMVRSARLVSLIGKSAAGKTALACALLNELLVEALEGRASAAAFARAKRVRIVNCTELLRLAMQQGLGEPESRELRAYRTASLLVLDDLGAEPRTGIASPIPDVIHYRYQEGLPTITTTGLTQRAVADRYDGGIERRIFTDEHAHVVWLGDAP